MTFPTRLGRIVGLLLLVHMATGLIVPYMLLLPITPGPAGFLETAAGMAQQVRLYVGILAVGGAFPIAISILLWPHVRERTAQFGLWLLLLAGINFALQLIENSHWLSMLSVSQAYAEAGSDTAALKAVGIAVRATWKWVHYSHIFVVVAWLFTFFCVAWRSALVPRALALLGMATCVLHFIGITLPVFAGFQMPLPELFGIPLGAADLALAGWLLLRGLREPHVPVAA